MFYCNTIGQGYQWFCALKQKQVVDDVLFCGDLTVAAHAYGLQPPTRFCDLLFFQIFCNVIVHNLFTNAPASVAEKTNFPVLLVLN